MLDELPPLQTTQTVHRFANPRDPLDVARRMGLDERAIEDMQRLLGPASRTMSPDELLRLKQITGVAALFANRDFSDSWEADSEEA